MHCVWRMAGRKLALFAHIDQYGFWIRSELVLELGDRAFGDVGSGFLNDLEKSRRVLLRHWGVCSGCSG